MFFGADDGIIRVLNADTGPAPDGTITNDKPGGVTLDGPIRASLAAYNGRLYALTVTGHLYCFK